MKKLITIALILLVVVIFLVKFADKENRVLLNKDKDAVITKDEPATFEVSTSENKELTAEEKQQIAERLKALGY